MIVGIVIGGLALDTFVGGCSTSHAALRDIRHEISEAHDKGTGARCFMSLSTSCLLA